MKQIWRNIVTVKIYLLVFFFISLLLTILVSFNYIPYFYYNTPLGTILFRLSMSYISSFIFYFIVVHLPKQKDRDYIYQYIKNDVCNIIDEGKMLSKTLKEQSNIDFVSKYPQKEKIEFICKSINSQNWINIMDQSRLKTFTAINDIYSKMPFIEGELIYLVDNIKDCLYFERIDTYDSTIHGTNLEYFNIPFLLYFQNIKELEEYVNDKFKYYKKRKPIPKEIKKLIK